MMVAVMSTPSVKWFVGVAGKIYMKGIYRQKLNIILVILLLVCNNLNCTNCCILYPRISPLYLNTLYLPREQVLSMEATMFFTVLDELNNLKICMTTGGYNRLCFMYRRGR